MGSDIGIVIHERQLNSKVSVFLPFYYLAEFTPHLVTLDPLDIGKPDNSIREDP